MINLLPPEVKQEYRYARRNRRLVQWSLAFVVATVGIVLLTVAGMAFMSRSIDEHAVEVAAAKARLADQNAAETQQQITSISNNLKLMVNVLSKEVLFSELLMQLGRITPPNVALTNLSVSQTVGAIDLTARANSYRLTLPIRPIRFFLKQISSALAARILRGAQVTPVRLRSRHSLWLITPSCL
jgi:Tfp pilus assembly protein PilN